MASYPDILVTSPESPRIQVAVGAQLERDNLDTTIEQLKRYLVGMSCPLGLLVFPDELRIFRNFFVSDEPSSVRQIGTYRLEGFPFESWKRFEQIPTGGAEFERAVQAWLEGLAERKLTKGLPPQLAEALEEHVLPALEQGVIGAAHPRETAVTRE